MSGFFCGIANRPCEERSNLFKGHSTNLSVYWTLQSLFGCHRVLLPCMHSSKFASYPAACCRARNDTVHKGLQNYNSAFFGYIHILFKVLHVIVNKLFE
jgi:hypothetical protein